MTSWNEKYFQVQYEPDGGDLGRAWVKCINPLEMMTVLPHIAYILECLYRSNVSRLPFCYAFEFTASVRKEIELVMADAKLPEHVKWYETDGKRTFEMRGVSGGVVVSHICYLITKQ